MEKLNIDISDPSNFEWKGSSIHGFDKESSDRIACLRKDTQSALSRKKRKHYSKIKLISLKDHLEYVANQQLLQLDLYSAALKHDARSLSIKNIGIAASIDDATSKKTENYANFQANVNQQTEDLKKIRQEKEQELKKEVNDLTQKLNNQNKNLESIKRTHDNLQIRAENHSKLLNNYNKYKEWIQLNNTLSDLRSERQRLENTVKRNQFRTEEIRYFNFDNDQQISENYNTTNQLQDDDDFIQKPFIFEYVRNKS